VTYWLKIAYFCYIFPTPLSFGALVPYVPALKLTVRKLQSWGYPPVKTAWSQLESFWHDTSVWRTFRRSDRIYHG